MVRIYRFFCTLQIRVHIHKFHTCTHMQNLRCVETFTNIFAHLHICLQMFVHIYMSVTHIYTTLHALFPDYTHDYTHLGVEGNNALCATWNSATTRSATQRLSMNWCRGLWCRLRLSNTTRTKPLPSNAITKMTASTTTSATASRASRRHSVTLAPVGVVSETADQSMDGYVSVITETDMLAAEGEELQRKRKVDVSGSKCYLITFYFILFEQVLELF